MFSNTDGLNVNKNFIEYQLKIIFIGITKKPHEYIHYIYIIIIIIIYYILLIQYICYLAEAIKLLN